MTNFNWRWRFVEKNKKEVGKKIQDGMRKPQRL
jgi:hypothetical protein